MLSNLKGRSIWKQADEMEEVNYRARNVWESHNSKEFIEMNKRFQSKLARRKYEPEMREMIEYIEFCEEEFN